MGITTTAAAPTGNVTYDANQNKIDWVYNTVANALSSQNENIRQTAMAAFDAAMQGTPDLSKIVSAAANLQMALAGATAGDEAVKKFIEEVSGAVKRPFG